MSRGFRATSMKYLITILIALFFSCSSEAFLGQGLGFWQSNVSNANPFGDGSGIALFSFDGNASDLSNTYNGTWSGTPAYVNGRFGQATDFSSGTNFISFGYAWQANPSFSISVWIYPLATPTGYQFIIDSRGNTDYRAATFYCENDGRISFLGTTSNGRWTDQALYKFGSSPSAAVWTHYVIVKSGASLSAYINGVLVASGAASSGGYTNVGTQVIGKGTSAGLTQSFNGYVDQLRIFNRALSVSEVLQLYNER
ncbi:MAG: LamG domain-containing protein [Bdellovibrionales bacterium]